MVKIDNILKNFTYQSYMKDIEDSEVSRRFCLHGINHSLDVARISYIINLEEGLGYEKDLVYAMALLHDIGRSVEYKEGIPHHEVGVGIARQILEEAGFCQEDVALIADAIAHHKQLNGAKKDLRYILFKADKLSRNCFDCKVYDECYWKEDLKNKTITY
ncbi:MAG: HD domain-containing protein [Lachnospiraceae bacterium]|nr:HD domain-containing protein [Lachnospiraceae bacterium]